MEFLMDLVKLFGPVGAICTAAAIALYRENRDLAKQNQAFSDKIMAAFVSDTEMKANMLNALSNLRETIEKFTSSKG